METPKVARGLLVTVCHGFGNGSRTLIFVLEFFSGVSGFHVSVRDDVPLLFLVLTWDFPTLSEVPT